MDGNRLYAELSFLRPDGSVHKAFAFVDMGSRRTVIAEALYKDLRLGKTRPLTFRVGNLAVQVPASEVASDPAEPHSVGSDLKVEAMLPAGVLQEYQNRHRLSRWDTHVGKARHTPAGGIAVPFHFSKQTGLIAVDASITIDNGSASHGSDKAQ